MTIKVIGAGFGRTGTLSLKYALEYLGFKKCYHMSEIQKKHPDHVQLWIDAQNGKPVDWSRIFQGYQATVDFPSCLFYKELLQQYPDAKVILTYRDPDRWYDSTKNTIYRLPRNEHLNRKPIRNFISRFTKKTIDPNEFVHLQDHILWNGTFSGRFNDKEYAKSIYQNHIDQVKGLVPSNQLLVFHVKEGWEPICNFLKVPTPTKKPFPHLNYQHQFGMRR